MINHVCGFVVVQVVQRVNELFVLSNLVVEEVHHKLPALRGQLSVVFESGQILVQIEVLLLNQAEWVQNVVHMQIRIVFEFTEQINVGLIEALAQKCIVNN